MIQSNTCWCIINTKSEFRSEVGWEVWWSWGSTEQQGFVSKVKKEGAVTALIADHQHKELPIADQCVLFSALWALVHLSPGLLLLVLRGSSIDNSSFVVVSLVLIILPSNKYCCESKEFGAIVLYFSRALVDQSSGWEEVLEAPKWQLSLGAPGPCLDCHVFAVIKAYTTRQCNYGELENLKTGFW